jgi:hypothetical protein
MKKGGNDRHKLILTVLKKAGFKVDNLEQHGKKTVITVSHAVQNSERAGVTVAGKIP